MNEMQPIATDDPVAWCVCQSVTHLRPTETVKPINILVSVKTLWEHDQETS